MSNHNLQNEVVLVGNKIYSRKEVKYSDPHTVMCIIIFI